MWKYLMEKTFYFARLRTTQRKTTVYFLLFLMSRNRCFTLKMPHFTSNLRNELLFLLFCTTLTHNCSEPGDKWCLRQEENVLLLHLRSHLQKFNLGLANDRFWKGRSIFSVKSAKISFLEKLTSTKMNGQFSGSFVYRL